MLELVTCSCPKCLHLPKKQRKSGFPENMIRVKYNGLGIRYLSPECIRINGYGEGNEKVKHKAKKHGIKIGLELEGTFPNTSSYGSAMCGIYGFNPTSDCSIYLTDGDTVAVELNTPIYQNLSGIQSILRSLESYGFHTHNNNTGHHVNISSNSLDIRKWRTETAKNVLKEIGTFLKNNSDICEYCFGRCFGEYCNMNHIMDEYSHYNFINTSNYNRIEFRIPKLNNSRQYFLTICLCREIYETIQKFIGTEKETQIAKKVIKILRGFCNNERPYQKRQTDKYSEGSLVKK